MRLRWVLLPLHRVPWTFSSSLSNWDKLWAVSTSKGNVSFFFFASSDSVVELVFLLYDTFFCCWLPTVDKNLNASLLQECVLLTTADQGGWTSLRNLCYHGWGGFTFKLWSMNTLVWLVCLCLTHAEHLNTRTLHLMDTHYVTTFLLSVSVAGEAIIEAKPITTSTIKYDLKDM